MHPLTIQAISWQSRSPKSSIGRPTTKPSPTMVPSLPGSMVRRLSRGMTIQSHLQHGGDRRPKKGQNIFIGIFTIKGV